MKKGYIANIEKETIENNNFRKVLYTAKNTQLVVMSLKPNEEIGEEVHGLDQFIRIEKGQAKAIIDGVESLVESEFCIIIPAGSKHNVINVGDTDLKIYTLYSPPEHKDGTVHQTKNDVQEEHFDGLTTE